jgi:Bacterial protein of unknown function (DUF885)
MPRPSRRPLFALLLALTTVPMLPAQNPPKDLAQLATEHRADLDDLARRHDLKLSESRRERMRRHLTEKRAQYAAIDLADAGREARVDRWLLLGDCDHRLAQLDVETAAHQKLAAFWPHAAPLVEAYEAHRRMEDCDGKAAAAMLHQAATTLEALQQPLRDGAFDAHGPEAARAACDLLADLHRAAETWRNFRDGYDPMFSWWSRAPWDRYAKAQQAWRDAVRARLVDGKSGDATLVGEPIGEAALLAELRHERIPYSPAELVAIAEREFAWCESEAKKASEELGCGGDWKKALELVKTMHRDPGAQPQLIRELAHEAIDFLVARDLLTVPDLARECWRMSMMSKEAQRVNPFFLGGETIQVSFPTDGMDHGQKLQSLRSNNEHFCRATVHHELIPGHWMQHFAMARHRRHREQFETPFWIEGWALYWEFRFYDLGLAKTPAGRVGMLYWRKHRCARIVFSLNYHLGNWTPRQCIDYLVEKVGHEPNAAEAEVRRSVTGGYSPLYQAAYMLGGLQFRALHDEIVGGGQMGEREFHDAILRQNAIPVALVRAALMRREPTEQDIAAWRFADVR